MVTVLGVTMRMFCLSIIPVVLLALSSCSWGGEPEVRIKLVEGKAVLTERAPPEIEEAVAAANRLVGKPYKWGGGHGTFDDTGYDCSGAASYVLREAGLMKGSRASSGFFQFGKKGRGDWLTVWVRKGHVFLTIGGARFDTHGETESDGPHWTMDKRDKGKFIPRKAR